MSSSISSSSFARDARRSGEGRVASPSRQQQCRQRCISNGRLQSLGIDGSRSLYPADRSFNGFDRHDQALGIFFAALERRLAQIQRSDLCPDLLDRRALLVDLLVAHGALGLFFELEPYVHRFAHARALSFTIPVESRLPGAPRKGNIFSRFAAKVLQHPAPPTSSRRLRGTFPARAALLRQVPVP